jgi:dihydrofolate reductase
MERRAFNIIVAVCKNMGIGAAGTMPWHIPADLAHFKSVTSAGTVIMGRLTWESIPEKFRPLSGRTNIVVTSRTEPIEGCLTAPGIEEALAVA